MGPVTHSDMPTLLTHLRTEDRGGSLGGAAVWRLPLAQGRIRETLDRFPHRAPGAWSLLLSACVSASLSLCYHK